MVAQGCAQRRKEDEQNYAPVAGLSTIKIFLATAAVKEWEVHHCDFTNAYINADLEEPVYIRCPQGYEDKHEDVVFYKLKKSLYVLRQSGKNWNGLLDAHLQRAGMVISETHPCLYTLKNDAGIGYLGLFVDDTTVTGTDVAGVKRVLKRAYPFKDLGFVMWILGINIERTIDGGLAIHQQHFIEETLQRYSMDKCKPVVTPLDPRVNLKNAEDGDQEVGPKVHYREAIGSLLYLAQGTRPDIAYAVSRLGQLFQDHQSNIGLQ